MRLCVLVRKKDREREREREREMEVCRESGGNGQMKKLQERKGKV